MDGYKLNPASAAKKLYNGNGTLDLFMRRVSPGKRFCSGAGKLGVRQGGGIDKVVELSQIQVVFVSGGISERDLICEALKFPPKFPSLFLQKR
jgi:hypothetical protein